MFVDVGVFLHDGTPALIRTIVAQVEGGRWDVHPIPSNSPLLSVGLNDDSPSSVGFSEQYESSEKGD